MDYGRDYDDEYDKQWASKYILGPLSDPEPSQVFATRISTKGLPPTPPSDSPPRPGLFSRHSRTKSQAGDDEDDEDPENQPFIRRILSRSSSVRSVNNRALPPSPPRPKPQPLSPLERKRSVHTSKPPQTRWNQGTILARANSVATSRPSTDLATSPLIEQAFGRRRGSSLAERYPGDRSHRPLEMLSQEHERAQEGEAPLRRSGSLRERYPGDLSHHPLAIIQREHRAADRAPHLHTHRRQHPSDTIDCLDHTGPLPEATYHHGGPFDPTMPARNTNKKYSPVEAVKDTNIEAIKATPVEFLKDSLDKHIPLQGTAVVPPGMKDMSGRTMEYREGDDLMRDRDAPGGPYKRWDQIPYADDDLKGKGEPAYTLDRRDKGKEVLRKPVAGSSSGMAYEMQPRTTGSSRLPNNDVISVRHRSASNADDDAPPVPPKDSSNVSSTEYGHSTSGNNMQRRNTTGKSFAESLKRRFGSLRRKKVPEERAY